MMPIVTIRGLMGSGAPVIGKMVAEKLHSEYVDREIIADVAKRLNTSTKGVIEKEMPPGSFLGRIVKALGEGFGMMGGAPGIYKDLYMSAYLPTWEMPLDDTRYLKNLETVIRELAASNQIVIRGRGSQFILKDNPEAMHVFVVAPLDIRIKRVMESQNLDEAEASKEIERFESSRRAFTKRYFDAELEDSIHYDLVINTNKLSFEDASLIILGALPLKDMEPK